VWAPPARTALHRTNQGRRRAERWSWSGGTDQDGAVPVPVVGGDGMRIIRYRIEVDDQVHEFLVPAVNQPFLYFAARFEDCIDFWILDDPELDTMLVRLRVVGTGHPVQRGEVWHATCVTPSQVLVWHVLEVSS
jgi:hypothetical protein